MPLMYKCTSCGCLVRDVDLVSDIYRDPVTGEESKPVTVCPHCSSMFLVPTAVYAEFHEKSPRLSSASH